MKLVRIMGEDGPPGECADLIIGYGGNHDWYIGVEGPEPLCRPSRRVRSDMARFSTSGGRFPAVTSIMALLSLVGSGDYEAAAKHLENVREWLTEAHARRPDPDEADAAVRAAIERGRKER